MITRPEDYRFVDFSSGDMPTDLFNGEIFPLRNEPRALKGEDIAFLYEAAAERCLKYEGATAGSFTFSSGFDTAKMIPTKVLLSSQMNKIESSFNFLNGIIDRDQFHPIDYQDGVMIRKLSTPLVSGGFKVDGTGSLVELREIYSRFISNHLRERQSYALTKPGDPLSASRIKTLFDAVDEYGDLDLVMLQDVSEKDDRPLLIDSFGRPFTPPESWLKTSRLLKIIFNTSNNTFGFNLYAHSLNEIGRIPGISVQDVRRSWMMISAPYFYSANKLLRSAISCALIDVTDLIDLSTDGDFCVINITASGALESYKRALAKCGVKYPYDDLDVSDQGSMIGSGSVYQCLVLEVDGGYRTTWNFDAEP